MAVNIFKNLPAPAANGVGAAVDVSTLGSSKAAVVAGSWDLAPITMIEFNNDAAQGGSWQSLGSIEGGGFLVMPAAAKWMRSNVQNFRGGAAPVVNVGGTDDGASFIALPAPAGNGSGAAVDSSALPIFKTVQVGGSYGGTVLVEVSQDGGTTWAQPFQFQGPGYINLSIACDFMRVTRVGVPVANPGLPVVNVGASSSGGGGGGGATGNPQRFTYVASGAEGDTFNVPLPAARASTGYIAMGQLADTTPAGTQYAVTIPTAGYALDHFQVRTGAAPAANDTIVFYVADAT